jgi:hypothetical protein
VPLFTGQDKQVGAPYCVLKVFRGHGAHASPPLALVTYPGKQRHCSSESAPALSVSAFAGHATHELFPMKSLYAPSAHATQASDAFRNPGTQRQSSASVAPSKLVVSAGHALQAWNPGAGL